MLKRQVADGIALADPWPRLQKAEAYPRYRTQLVAISSGLYAISTAIREEVGVFLPLTFSHLRLCGLLRF